MAQDPAFLFYYQDFLIGTEFMSAEETGLYIRILCHMADKGKLSLRHIQSICKGYAFTDNVKEKFLVDKDGFFFNKRLRHEVEKRRLYAESRRKNAKAYAKHMENENENINNSNVNINNDSDKDNVISDQDKWVGKYFAQFWSTYPKRIGESLALITFRATIKTDKDFDDLKTALKNYLASDEVKKGFIMKGSTWMEDWRGWLDMAQKPQTELDKYKVAK